MIYRIKSVTRLIIFNFLLLLLSCSNSQKNSVTSFVDEYINTVSSEHAKYKSNITEKMKNYYMDYENKELAEMPEFLEIGPFRNNVLVINSYKILSIKEIKDVKIPECKYVYDIDVQFEIETENGNYKQKIANYWVTFYKNKFYIYGDNFLQDIYILKKDTK
ncbi:MAG: hypothetical protein K5829_06910 [Treponema sp.]|nr:hypothetical protein [Treponema sp.]